MKRKRGRQGKIANRTVVFSMISSMALGLACLLVGLNIYANSLMKQAVTNTRVNATRAAMAAQKTGDTTALSADVMAVYAVALDKARGAFVCLSDADQENPQYPGEWFAIPDEWVEKLAADIKKKWDSESTLYFLQSDPENGRKIVAIYPIADESVDISDTEHRNIAYAVAECYINDVAENILHYALKVGAVVMVITLLTSIYVGLRMKHAVADPINAIAKTAAAYAQDRKNGVARSDHFSSLGIRTGDELENLTDIMAEMERDLTEHEEHITQITAEKERISVELNMASEIQASVLPRIFPAFPERRDFDLYAFMTPAKEVGGDFYDFFMIDDDHLALVIADVSGKGVPAALFMMIAKSLIKDQLLNGCDPALALQRTNAHLIEGNTSATFVTVWLAVLELSTGRGMACNAGHENPGFLGSGGTFELLRYKHNMFVGVSKRARYQNRAFEMKPGDSLFVYTDGVPEAKNAAGEMFGEARMIEALNREPDATAEVLLGHVRGAVDAFVKDAPQFDDITMLAFKYHGPVPETEKGGATGPKRS